jgi:RNA polymerase sigma factor (sigma-70 family)
MERNAVGRERGDPAVNVCVRFPDTSWTLLRQASTCPARRNPAIDEFADRYYRAVHAYIAAIVRNATMAEELTQEFFISAVLSGRLLHRVDRGKGSFRPYLKQAIRNFLIDEHRRRSRRRDEVEGTSRGVEPSWDVSDDRLHEPDAELLRAWGQSVVRVALARVEAISHERGQDVHFQLFARRFLDDSDDLLRWKDVGETFNLDEKTARSRADIIVRRFRAVLWEVIATDPGSDKNFEEELADLMAVL